MKILMKRRVFFFLVALTSAVLIISLAVSARRESGGLQAATKVVINQDPLLPPTPLALREPLATQEFQSLNTLRAATNATEATSAWHKAKKELLNHHDSAEALEAVRALLESGADHALDAPLQVSVGGELKLAPSTRVYALDLLAQLDSAEAAEYSKIILESSTSSDEWAIALRNYAWGMDSAASDPFLRGKVLELLTNETWVSQPTSGFLESLDFVPYTQDPALVAPLVSLTKSERPENVRRAAFLALARLHSQDTTTGLQGVSDAEALEPFSPVRADAMSRADFTRAADVEMVRSYLLSSSVDPKEYEMFVETFPQGGQFAGPALATTFQPLRFSNLARRDARALSIVKEWMSDPSFESRRKELSQIYQTLIRLNESAVEGGYL